MRHQSAAYASRFYIMLVYAQDVKNPFDIYIIIID